MQAGIPLSLYIHMPWCIEKCPYCDFNSHVLTEDLQETNYIQQLFRNLEQQLPWVWGRRIETIFIGGGTPSLFSGQAMDDLLSGVRARLALQPDLEITIESNPGTADTSNFKAYHKAGINRISIGIQSLDDDQLKTLGRIHCASEAIQAVEFAKQSGFKRINCDLMFGLPNQSVAQALSDLQGVIDLGVEHISWYQLTIEPNTEFYRHTPSGLADDDHLINIQQQGKALLQSFGYQQYEISAWAKPGAECRHNLNYWQFGDYLGIGAGAHGKITDLNEQAIYRTRAKKQPKHWLASDSELLAQRKAITQQDLALEYFMNVLRLKNGVERNTLFERTGLIETSINKPLQQAIELELMAADPKLYKTTEKGFDFLNDLLALFMPDDQLIAKQPQ